MKATRRWAGWLAAGWVLLTPAWAGAIFTTNNQVAVGAVSEDDTTLYLKMEFGTVKYKRDKVRWYTTDPKVDSIFLAGLEANRQKQAEVAMQLLRESARKEAKFRREADEALKKIGRELAPEPKVAESTAKPREQETPKAAGNTITQAVKDRLVRVHETSGQVMGFDESTVAGKQYYAIYFSAHWCPPCRGFTPKLVAFYNEMKPLHPDKFEIIFVSYDRDRESFNEYMTGAKMPWPALDFDDRQGNHLATYAARGIPCLVLVDSNGTVVAHSYVDGQYVGPVSVMEELRKRLTAE